MVAGLASPPTRWRTVTGDPAMSWKNRAFIAARASRVGRLEDVATLCEAFEVDRHVVAGPAIGGVPVYPALRWHDRQGFPSG